jgi:hypothetical protein
VPLLLLRVRECEADDRGVREGEAGGDMGTARTIVSVCGGGEAGRGRSAGAMVGVVGSAVMNDSTDDGDGRGADTASVATAARSSAAGVANSGWSDMFAKLAC